MSNIRNSQLLQQMARHPLKAALARALDIAETFAGDVEFLQLDKNLSDAGRANARSAKLRAAIRDLRDARGPLNELETKLAAKRAAVAMPAFDPKDSVGFLRRQELRSVLRTMDAGARAMHLGDPAFADAMLEQPPIVSGFFLAEDFKGTLSPEIQRDRDIVAAAKEKRLAGIFGRELEEIAALESTIAEANMIANVARNDLQATSGLEPAQFNEFAKPVEAKQNAPWLKRDKDVGGNDVIYALHREADGFVGRIATPDEQRDGVFFKNFAEYQASRAA